MSDFNRDHEVRPPEPPTVPNVPSAAASPEPDLSPHEPPSRPPERLSSVGDNACEMVREIFNLSPGEEQLAQEGAEQAQQDLFGSFVDPQGRFHIVEQIYCLPGKTAVYKAMDRTHGDRFVAIKIVFAFGDPQRLNELEMEARRTARLDTSYAPIVYDHGIDSSNDFGWMAMEYLEGGTLKEHIHKDKRLDWDRVRKVCTDILEGLRNGYACGLTHRDLKPSNIMRSRKGSTWKIVDWGIAYPISPATGVGLDSVASGTPNYMAPEVFWERPSRVSPQADFYALGVMIIEMLTGNNPFAALSDADFLRVKKAPHLADYLEDAAEVPEEARGIVARVTAQEATHRYRNVDEFLAALDPQKARRKRRLRTAPRFALAGMIVLVLIAAALLLPWRTTPARFKGTFNLWLVERNDKPLDEARALGGPDTLPLRVADRIFLQTKLDQGPEAYFSLLWIDSNGKATRLHPNEWISAKLASGDKKRVDLRWPEKGGSAKLSPSTDGLESVLWMVRDKPWSRSDDEELQALLDGLTWHHRPEQKGAEIIVYWENGLRGENRGAPDPKTIHTPDDPISQTEKLLLALKAKGLVQYSRAVCYSFVGR